MSFPTAGGTINREGCLHGARFPIPEGQQFFWNPSVRWRGSKVYPFQNCPLLPSISEMTEDFLQGIDTKVSIDAGPLEVKKKQGVFSFLQIFRWGGSANWWENKASSVFYLTSAASSLLEGCSLTSLARADITLAAIGMEDFEASSKTIMKVITWLNWNIVSQSAVQCFILDSSLAPLS